MELIIITRGQVIIYKGLNIKKYSLLYLFLMFLINFKKVLL